MLLKIIEVIETYSRWSWGTQRRRKYGFNNVVCKLDHEVYTLGGSSYGNYIFSCPITTSGWMYTSWPCENDAVSAR